jgi:hypothetical protein
MYIAKSLSGQGIVVNVNCHEQLPCDETKEGTAGTERVIVFFNSRGYCTVIH